MLNGVGGWGTLCSTVRKINAYQGAPQLTCFSVQPVNALCSSLVRPDGNHMWFAPKQNMFLPLEFIKRWVMFLQAISVESNEAPRKTFPAGRFLIFFLSWSSRFSIYHETKRSSGFLVTCLTGLLVLKHRDLYKMSQRERIVQTGTARRGYWRVLPGDILMFAHYFWSRFTCVWHSAPDSCHTCACWRERFVMTFRRKGEFYLLE